MSNPYRNHTCGELGKNALGQVVSLAGWVHRRRDHGGLIFIDLRDRFGITQIVFNPEKHPQCHALANQLRSEWVISVTGKVVSRLEGMVNPKLKTGEIELEATEVRILSKAQTPPFSIADENLTTNEELRLKYRYLDMRRHGGIGDKLIARHKIMLATRTFMDRQGFLEINTPILGKSTPEGARDYLVPSRIHPGMFYALPQSPQIFKQLLMIGGMDRYFQIATCFRDEDLRADRQPEFTQIDVEMSFATAESLFGIIEGLVASLFKEVKGIALPVPFPRMSHADAIENYGTDKPDLRFGMPLVRLTELAKESTFPHFLEQIQAGNCVKGLCIKGGEDISRKGVEGYSAFVARFGVNHLTSLKVQQDGSFASSLLKFLPTELCEKISTTMQAEKGDLLLFLAGPQKSVNQALDHLRRHIASERKLIDPHAYAFSWITDFPLFQWDDEAGRMECEHHPFTSPNREDLHLLDSEPLRMRSSSYDLVLNGYEIASGSERIFEGQLQEKIFQILKLSQEELKDRFGFFIEALSYGTPPHLGIALGLDRLTMILTQTEGIRDVIAFPKTQKASDLMLEAPSSVHKLQLAELKIHVEETT